MADTENESASNIKKRKQPKMLLQIKNNIFILFVPHS